MNTALWEEMNDEEKTEDFIRQTKTEVVVAFLRHGPYWDGETEDRDVYEITLIRGEHRFKFPFGQSLVASGPWAAYLWSGQKQRFFPKKGVEEGLMRELKRINSKKRDLKKLPFGNNGRLDIRRNSDFSQPDTYSILTCLTKYDPGTFEDFCGDFGYDTDSIKALKTYEGVKNKFENLQTLYSDKELEAMAEIQ